MLGVLLAQMPGLFKERSSYLVITSSGGVDDELVTYT